MNQGEVSARSGHQRACAGDEGDDPEESLLLVFLTEGLDLLNGYLEPSCNRQDSSFERLAGNRKTGLPIPASVWPYGEWFYPLCHCRSGGLFVCDRLEKGY